MGDTLKFVSALRKQVLSFLDFLLFLLLSFPIIKLRHHGWKTRRGVGWGLACNHDHGCPPAPLSALEWVRAQFKSWFLHLRAVAPGRFLNSATPAFLTCKVEIMPSTS